MQVSRKKIKPVVRNQIYNLLLIADIKNPYEAKEFLGSFLGESEQEIIAVSSTTVASIAKQINKGKGFKIALEKIQADEWAEKWSRKISQVFSKKQK